MHRTAALVLFIGLAAPAGPVAAQTGPQQEPGQALTGDMFGLEGSEWRPTFLPGSELLASGYVGQEVFLDVSQAGGSAFGFLRYRLAPHLFDNGHYLDGIVLQTPPVHFVDVFGCDPRPVQIGRIEGCFDPDLKSIRATTYLHPVTDPSVCEPMRTRPGAVFPEQGSRFGITRATPIDALGVAASNPVADLDLRELTDYFRAEIDPRLRQMDLQDTTTLQIVHFRLAQVRERLRTFPTPNHEGDRGLYDYLVERLEQAETDLDDRPELSRLPAALTPGTNPRKCLLDPPRGCDPSAVPESIGQAMNALRTALNDAARRHDGLPDALFYQDGEDREAVLSILREQIWNRGPDRWLNLAGSLDPPGHGDLIVRLQRMAFFDWCDDEGFLDVEARTARLRDELTAHQQQVGSLLDHANAEKTRLESDIRWALDTWTEWSVFDRLFGTNITPTGVAESVIAATDVLLWEFGFEPTDPNTRVLAQLLDQYIATVMALIDEQPLIEVSPRVDSAMSWFQLVKSWSDILLAIWDLWSLSEVGDWIGDDAPDDLLPLYLRYSEQAAYLEHLLAHDRELGKAVDQLQRVLAEERARRF